MSVKYGSTVPLEGLVLAWDPANERSYPRSGSIITDISGNGNDGTFINAPTLVDNQYLNFDGVDQQINLASDIILTSWTIVYWFYHDATTDNDMTIGETGTTDSRFYHRDLDANYKLRVTNNSNVNVGDMNLSDIGRRQWGMLAYSMVPGVIQGWVNGVTKISTTTTDSSEFHINTFGYPYSGNVVYYWRGRLGPLYVYNRATTTNEIIEIYNAHRNRFTP